MNHFYIAMRNRHIANNRGSRQVDVIIFLNCKYLWYKCIVIWLNAPS